MQHTIKLAASIAILAMIFVVGQLSAAIAREPMPIGIVGLTHTHVHWLFESEKRGDVKIVGIVETNKDLARRYLDQYGKSMELVYDDLDVMLDATKPVGVTAFGSIFEHLSIVETAAPRGVHVMVEKPLAVNLDHAKQMYALAKRHNIHLLTNYETTWYPTTHKARDLLEQGAVGPVKKMMFRHGHKGPKKIGVNDEFLEWLIDPELNGGGAIIDFGCYGANLMTWLMKGKQPISVTAITRNFQSENYPNVDDEAIIMVDYSDATGIIQASWNWPIARKDMAIYGVDGEIHADDRHKLRIREHEESPEQALTMDERPAPFDDPFALFRAVIEGEVALEENDLSALENNMRVMEILDAAIKSAQSGQTVRF